MNGFIGELFGTYVLIVLGTGACAGTNLNRTYAKGSDWTFVSLAWGLAVTMGVYVASSLGSLGHLNPAVTIPHATLAVSFGPIYRCLSGGRHDHDDFLSAL